MSSVSIGRIGSVLAHCTLVGSFSALALARPAAPNSDAPYIVGIYQQPTLSHWTVGSPWSVVSSAFPTSESQQGSRPDVRPRPSLARMVMTILPICLASENRFSASPRPIEPLRPVDDRGHLAGLEELGHLRQTPVRVQYVQPNVPGPGPGDEPTKKLDMEKSETGAAYRHVAPAGFECAHEGEGRALGSDIQDQVVAFSGAREIFLAIVDRVIASQRAEHGERSRRCRRP